MVAPLPLAAAASALPVLTAHTAGHIQTARASSTEEMHTKQPSKKISTQEAHDDQKPANTNTEQTADAVAAAEERPMADTQDQEEWNPEMRAEARMKDEGLHIKKNRKKKKLKLQLRNALPKKIGHRTGAGTSNLEKASGSSRHPQHFTDRVV